MAEKGKPRKDESPWQQASLALSIPTLMVAGPLVGYLLALLAIHLFSIGDPWKDRAEIIGLLIGGIAGGRETIRLIKRISSDS